MNISSSQVNIDNSNVSYKGYSSSSDYASVTSDAPSRKPANKDVSEAYSKTQGDIPKKAQIVSDSRSTSGDAVAKEALGIENEEAARKISESSVNNTVNQVNKKLRPANTEIQYSYHEATKQISFKVVNQETGEIIREIPSEKVLDMLEKMWEMAGILVDEKR